MSPAYSPSPIVFGQVLKTSERDTTVPETKSFSDYKVAVDRKSIYFGPQSNFRVDWNKIEDLKVWSTGLTIQTANQLFHCQNPSSTAWTRFSNWIEKRWNKVNGDKGPADTFDLGTQHSVKSTKAKSKRKREYGGRSLPGTSYVERDLSKFVDDHMSSYEPASDRHQLEAIQYDDVMTDHVGDYSFSQINPRRRKRLKKARLVQAENEDSNTDMFGSDHKLTTPSSKHVVTPHISSSQTESNEEEEQEPPAQAPAMGMKPISSFFGPAASTRRPMSPPVQKTRTPSPETVTTPTRPPLDSKQNTEWLSTKRPPRSSHKKTRPSHENGSDDENTPFATVAPTSLFSPSKRSPEEEMRDRSHTPFHRRNRRRGDPFVRPRFPSQSPRTLPLSTAEAALGTRSPAIANFKPRINPYKNTLAIEKTPIEQTCPWRGLKNLGNTCYINASLQMLMSVPSLLQSLIGKGGELTHSMVSVLSSLERPNAVAAADTREFKETIDKVTDRFTGFEQRDAHEFLSDLIDRVHVELEENKENPAGENEELPTDDFRLTVEVCLTCDSCGYARTMKEIYRHLSLDIDDHLRDDAQNDESEHWSIEKGLAQFFRPEQREVRCEKCEHGSSATQTLRILSRPKVLLLHLKRFAFVQKSSTRLSSPEDDAKENEPSKENQEEETRQPDPVVMTFRKNRAPVTIQEHVTLDSFVADKHEAKADKVKYNLKSVVYHIGGTAFSGHYTASSVRPSSPTDTSTKWFMFDDGSTTSTTSRQVMEIEQSQKTAYMLLYTSDTKTLMGL